MWITQVYQPVGVSPGSQACLTFVENCSERRSAVLFNRPKDLWRGTGTRTFGSTPMADC